MPMFSRSVHLVTTLNSISLGLILPILSWALGRRIVNIIPRDFEPFIIKLCTTGAFGGEFNERFGFDARNCTAKGDRVLHHTLYLSPYSTSNAVLGLTLLQFSDHYREFLLLSRLALMLSRGSGKRLKRL